MQFLTLLFPLYLQEVDNWHISASLDYPSNRSKCKTACSNFGNGWMNFGLSALKNLKKYYDQLRINQATILH